MVCPESENSDGRKIPSTNRLSIFWILVNKFLLQIVTKLLNILALYLQICTSETVFVNFFLCWEIQRIKHLSPYVKNMFCWQLIRVLVQFFLNFKHQNFERKAKHINPSNVQKKVHVYRWCHDGTVSRYMQLYVILNLMLRVNFNLCCFLSSILFLPLPQYL